MIYPSDESFPGLFSLSNSDNDSYLILSLQELNSRVDLQQFISGKSQRLDLPGDTSFKSVIKSFYWESNSRIRKKGMNPLCLGSTIMLHLVEDEWMFSPVFTWMVKLGDVFGGMMHLRPAIEKEKPSLAVNPFIIKSFPHLEKELNREVEQLNRSNTFTFEQLTQKTADLFSVPVYAESLENLKRICIVQHQEKEFGRQGIIVPAIYLGLLSQETLLPEMKAGKSKTNILEYPLGLMKTDAYQASAFKKMQKNNLCAVSGTKGSGKTSLLIHYITAALANEKNCLVLSGNLAPLKSIQTELAKLDLATACFLLSAQPADHQLLLNYLRTSLNINLKSKSNPSEEYRTQRDRLLWNKAKLDQQYKSVKKPLVGNFNWTYIVGKYLINNNKEGRAVLSNDLNPLSFKFLGEEYEYLDHVVRKGALLKLHKVNNQDSLSELHPHLFTRMEMRESRDFLTARLNYFINALKKVIQQYAAKQNEYAELLYQHYDQYRAEILNKLAALKDNYADAEISHGNLLNTSSGKLKMKGLFSKKHQQIYHTKNKIAALYQDFVQYFQQTGLFSYQFPRVEDLKPFSQIETITANFETAFNLWRKDITGLIQEEMNRLSIKTAIPELKYEKQLQNLEQQLNALIQEINQTPVLATPVEHKMLILPQQQHFMEDLKRRLERIQHSLKDYDDFYIWNKFWLQLNPAGKRVIGALLKVNPQNWSAAFESWYWHHALIRFDHTAISTTPPDFEPYHQQLKSFLPLHKAQVQTNVDGIKQNALQKIKKKSKSSYQALYSKSTQRPSLAITQTLAKNFSDLSQGIPVLLSTPNGIATILQSCSNLNKFENILVEDAHTICTEQLEHILTWGENITFFYNPAVASTEWLNWLEESVDTIQELKNNYQFSAADLSRLTDTENDLLQEGISDITVDFQQIDGRYDEISKTNNEEAQLVLRLLNEIPANQQRTFPRVGIVCFSRAQRDLILQYIYQIKYDNLPGTERIEQLLRNGLEVVTLSEIPGEDYQVLIICPTFGPVNLNGDVPKDMEVLETEQAITYLYELMGIQARHIFMINSIPGNFFQKKLSTGKKDGYFIWAAYVLNLIALSENNNIARQNILRQWQEVCRGTDKPENTTYPFISQILDAIKPYLEKDVVLKANFNIGNLSFPFVLEKQTLPRQVYYFTAEGFLADTPVTDYAWERNQRQQLEQQGFFEISVSSLNWWKDSKRELQRILNQLATKEEIINSTT